MLEDRIGNWSTPQIIKQMVAQSGLTLLSATNVTTLDTQSETVIPTHFPTTDGAFWHTMDTTYAIGNIV